MKKCVCCGRETYHKVNEQTVCAQCDVDGSFEYHLKQQAAQPLRAVDLPNESRLPSWCDDGFDDAVIGSLP